MSDKFKIKQYVHNGVLPINIQEYQHPGNRADCCPFCDDPHHENKHVEPELGVVFYTCDDCEYLVSIERLQQNGGRGTVVSTVDSRIKLYKDYGEFGPEVSKELTEHHGSCYFCKQSMLELDIYAMSLSVPVHDACHGGFVDICKACATRLNYKQFDYKHVDKCVSCAKIYPISEYEYTLRKKIVEKFGKFLCPSCVSEIHGTLKQDRFISRNCTMCRSDKLFDIHEIISTNLIPNKRTFICDPCKMREEQGLILTYDTPCTMYAILNQNRATSLWGFTLFKTKLPGVLEQAIVLQEAPTVYRNAYIVAEEVQDKFDEIVNKTGKQRQLWF